MSRLIKSFLTSIYQFFHLLQGEITVREVFKHNRVIGSMKVDVFHGCAIEVVCSKRQYIRNPGIRLFKSKMHTVFDVYGKIDGIAPPTLHQVLQTKITFPPMIPLYLDDQMHVKALVNAYLDMIESLLTEPRR